MASSSILSHSCAGVRTCFFRIPTQTENWQSSRTYMPPGSDCDCGDIQSHGLNNSQFVGLSIRKQPLLDFSDQSVNHSNKSHMCVYPIIYYIYYCVYNVLYNYNIYVLIHPISSFPSRILTNTMRDLALLIPKWDVSITTLLSRFRDLCKEGSRKIIRARVHGQFQINIVFQTRWKLWDWCTYELTDHDSMHKIYTSSDQTKSQHREVDTKFHP